jgi:hypothetical protein
LSLGKKIGLVLLAGTLCLFALGVIIPPLAAVRGKLPVAQGEVGYDESISKGEGLYPLQQLAPRAAAPQEFAIGEVAEMENKAAAANFISTASLETWGRQLILTGAISLEVTEVRAAFERIQALAAAEGALVTNASLQANTDADSDKGYAYATLVLRMPQSRFHAMRQKLTRLAGDLNGKVTADEVSSQDVTEEYVDLKARLHHMQSEEIQLLEIMRQAKKIPDLLSVRNQLSAVQQEIERLQGRLRFLENRVDLSTITVNIRQEGNAAHAGFAATWKQIGKNLQGAWSKSLQNVVILLGYLVVLLIYLLPFALITVLIWALVRRNRKKALAKVPGESAN